MNLDRKPEKCKQCKKVPKDGCISSSGLCIKCGIKRVKRWQETMRKMSKSPKNYEEKVRASMKRER